MTPAADKPNDKAAVVLAGAEGSLSRAELTAYRDDLLTRPVLSLKEMRRLSALLGLPDAAAQSR